MEKLKEIALELLNKYNNSERNVIWEYSGSIDQDLNELEDECKWYHEEIEAAANAVERKRGKWILVKGSNGKDYHKCSECLHVQDITCVKNYCAVCGADMMGEGDG